MKLYKYCAKNNDNRASSYFNGKERIGFESCNAEDGDIEKLLAKGWVKGLPTKTRHKKKVKDGDDQRTDSKSSTESGGAGNEVQESND